MAFSTEPPPHVAVRHALDPAIEAGHRKLLETLRDLIAPCNAAECPAETVRGQLAFLRHGVLPFARREEAELGGSGDAWESTAFEHAFLQAEIDRFGRQAQAYLDAASGPSDHYRLTTEMRRSLIRIEAILELHVEKEWERTLLSRSEHDGRFSGTPV